MKYFLMMTFGFSMLSNTFAAESSVVHEINGVKKFCDRVETEMREIITKLKFPPILDKVDCEIIEDGVLYDRVRITAKTQLAPCKDKYFRQVEVKEICSTATYRNIYVKFLEELIGASVKYETGFMKAYINSDGKYKCITKVPLCFDNALKE